MNKRTHIWLGRIVWQFAESALGIRLDRGGFLFGNILPDVCLSFVTRPHTVDHTLGLVNKKIGRLNAIKHGEAYIGRSFSRRLGVICHYYADFFCYPHSRGYAGDLKDHVAYIRSNVVRTNPEVAEYAGETKNSDWMPEARAAVTYGPGYGPGSGLYDGGYRSRGFLRDLIDILLLTEYYRRRRYP